MSCHCGHRDEEELAKEVEKAGPVREAECFLKHSPLLDLGTPYGLSFPPASHLPSFSFWTSLYNLYDSYLPVNLQKKIRWYYMVLGVTVC